MSTISRHELAQRVIQKWAIPSDIHPQILPSNDSEAAEKVLFIHQALRLLYPENPEIRNNWINMRQANLGDKRPIDVIVANEEGIDEICGLLNQMLYR